MNRPWLAAWVLVLFGLFGGCAFDPRPERPVVHRAGYRVLEGDLHAHTTYSDGTLSPLSLVRQAERRGIDVLAVTEHNTTVAGRIARLYAAHFGGPLVLVGEEITTARYHLIAVGIERTIAPGPITDVVDAIHGQGGVAIAAHPVTRFQPGLAPARALFDGVEVMHPIAFAARSAPWRWSDMVDYYETTTPRAAAIGSSDYHFASVLGLCRTLLFVSEPVTATSVLDAIRARHTVVVDAHGALRGDPEMVAALEREPYAVRGSDYAYRGEGAVDRTLRFAGLLGVAGVVFLRRRRRYDAST